MSKLSFRARALDASKPMPIYLAEELPDLPEYSAINRAVPQMPSGMEKEEECEHHLQRAICTGLIIPTPEVCEVNDLQYYERCYPPDYKMPKQNIHMQPLWQEQETPEYDMDSEDERWLRQQRHPELTELKFEEMMDKLEKSSGQTVVTLSEAKLLLERHDDLIVAVYDYWLNKRLKTQHPLILSVKTENRPGQSANNPYLAFRRRTEKMQTRKNRKNDESSYEKMLKLRRDLARALTLLELVARREKAKRDLVKLTALLAEKRYVAGDFASHLVPEPPPRPQYTTVHIPAPAVFRRESYTVPHYPPRAPPTPVDQPRQREKRPYKRRKHRHHAAGSTQGLRDSGVCTSSEEEPTRADTASPPDDGPFAFRRKPGCFYEVPTSTLSGDPVDPDAPKEEVLFQHEIDERYRYTLTSVKHPYPHCVGFARRRVGRGGRVILDRISTPLDDLWPRLDWVMPGTEQYRKEREELVELETKLHRHPKEISRDYHTSGKHPWRHAFRQHLARHPELWTVDDKTEVKTEVDCKLEGKDVKVEGDDVKCDISDIKLEPMDIDKVLPDESVNKNVKSDISDNARTIDNSVKENLNRVLRKRSWSGCSDSSYDSDETLQPVEKEFESFISEVNKKWLHFRPKTPPPTSTKEDSSFENYFPITTETPITVELRTANEPPSDVLDTFTTSEFTLGNLYADVMPQEDTDFSGDDLLTDNFTGLTEAQVESILSETDLKALADVELTKDDKKLPEDLLEELVKEVETKDSFLFQGQSLEGRAGSGPRKKRLDAFGSSVVHISELDKDPIYIEKIEVRPKVKPSPPKKSETPKENKIKLEKVVIEPAPVPKSKIIIEEVNEIPHIKIEKKKKEDTIEEVQLGHGVQLKTVQTKHSPLKKHIITSAAHRRPSDVTLVSSQEAPQPHLVTVAVSDSLKVRLQNHLAVSQAASGGATVVGVVQNGPFAQSTPVAVALPLQNRDAGGVGMGMGVGLGVGVGRRVSVPLQLSGARALSPSVVVGGHALHALPHNKLKVVHAAHLTHTQRNQLLAHSRSPGITQLPTVVSLATLGDGKTSTNTTLIKATPGSVAQLFEIKSSQISKGPHLLNVVQQAPNKAVPRLDINDAKKRQVFATFDGAGLKGSIATATRPTQRVSVSVDGRQIVRPTLSAVRAPHVRHQIQLKNRTLQVTQPIRSMSEASTSITIATPTKTASIPSSVVANLLQKQLPKSGQKIAISGITGQALSANVQAIAFPTAQLKARQARLIAQPRPTPVPDIVDAATVPVATSSTSGNVSEAPHEGVTEGEETTTNGTVRRRAADTLPMEVT